MTSPLPATAPGRTNFTVDDTTSDVTTGELDIGNFGTVDAFPDSWVLDNPADTTVAGRNTDRDEWLAYFGLTTSSDSITQNPLSSISVYNSQNTYQINGAQYNTDTGGQISSRIEDSQGNIVIYQLNGGIIFNFQSESGITFGLGTSEQPRFRLTGDWTVISGDATLIADNEAVTFEIFPSLEAAQLGAQPLVSSTVQISIPTEGINETFTLTNGLTTATALRNDLFTMISSNTNITDEFTVAQAVADAMTTGVTAGEPIITLVANDDTDHTIGVTFNNGTGGDLSNSAFGSHIEGVPGETATVPTATRITYDANLTPSFQDIVLGQANDSAAIATTVTSMINAGHNEVMATQGNAAVVDSVTGDVPGIPTGTVGNLSLIHI